MGVSASNSSAGQDGYSFEFAANLPDIDENQARFSAGFLRCRPEKWFPGLASHWLPFWHSLGLEVKVIEVKTALKAAVNLDKGYYGVVDDERVAICLDAESEQIILGSISPGADANAESVLSEYLARRFFSSIALSWSAAENAKVQFRSQIQTHSFNEAGAVKLTFSINNNICNLWLLLGESLVARFDGLWRRQLGPQQKEETSHKAEIELFSMELLPTELEAQVRPKHFISFSNTNIDNASLIVDGRPHIPVKLCRVGQELAIQTNSSVLGGLYSASGRTRVHFRFPSFKISEAELNEVTQIGAVQRTGLSAESEVELHVQERLIARGRLAYFLGNLGVLIS